MSDFNTENNNSDIKSGENGDIVLTATEADYSNTKNDSSPAKSPEKSKQNGKAEEEEDFFSQRESQDRRIQALMRIQNQNNSPPKGKNQNEKNDKLKHSKTYGEDIGESRQRSDKDVSSPNKLTRGESDLSSGQGQATPNRKTDSFDDYEAPQRTNSMAADKSTEYSASLLLPARNSDITKSVCVGRELKFMDKSNWTDELKCYVCARSFNKMDGIFTHHCRACGKSVCGDCSTRKINDNRACDVCFYKASNVLVEEKRKILLNEKSRQIKEYKRKVEEAQKRLEELNQKKKDLEKQIYQEREEQDNAFLNLQKEKVKVQETLDKKKSNNQKLKETIETEQEYLRKKEAETNEMKEILNSIKLDLAEKKGNINSKQEEAERLISQKQYYEKPYYSCLDPTNGSVLQRDPSVVGSCYPDLPGTEASNHVQEDSIEVNSQEEVNE